MYDSHLYAKDYKYLKDLIISMMNGEDIGKSVDDLATMVNNSYQDGDISSYNYDELIGYLQEMEY